MSTKITGYAQTRTPPSHDTADLDETAVPELNARLQEMYASGKSRVNEWKGGLQDGIRAHPVRSLLIAGAVGAVLGLILTRRS